MYTGIERRRNLRREGDLWHIVATAGLAHQAEAVRVRSEPAYPCYASTAESDERARKAGFDPFKPLCNLKGESVILITTNGPENLPLIGLVRRASAAKNWSSGVLHRWSIEGCSYEAKSLRTRVSNLVSNHYEPFDINRPFRTRDGKDVRILGHDRKGERSLVGLIQKRPDYEVLHVWYPDGRSNATRVSESDLVNYED